MGPRSRIAAACLVTAVLCSCGNQTEPVGQAGLTEDAALDHARSVAQALAAELMQRLQREMNSGGAEQAVRVCAGVAQEMAAAHSSEGVTVRRVSLKVRNPADAPDEFERGALERLEALHGEGKLPAEWVEVVSTAEGDRLRYMRPLSIQPLCLACHGPADSLAPEVAALIAESYPEDRAVGYAVGDLRGAISVIVPMD